MAQSSQEFQVEGNKCLLITRTLTNMNNRSLLQSNFHPCSIKSKLLLLFSLLIFFLPVSIKAQQLEIRASLNSGLYAFGGDGATSVSQINGTVYTNNPYGSKGGLSYGLSLDIRKVTKSKFIYGADLGYEMLRSKVNLKYADVIGDIASDFEGKTYLNTSFINLFPYLGARFDIKQQAFDLTGGLDIGYVLTAREKGSAKSIDNAQFEIETSTDRKNLKTDLRPRIQLSTNFNKAGVYVGYSHGLINYTGNYVGLTKETYSRMWRIGVTYRLK